MSEASEPVSSKEPNNRDSAALVSAPEPLPSSPETAAEQDANSAPNPEPEPVRSRPRSRERMEFEEEPEPEKPVQLPFDPWRLADALVRTWYLWISAGILCAAAASYWYASRDHTVASMQLVRRDPPILVRASDAGEAFKPQEFKDQTLMDLVRTPELFRRVGAHVKPPVPLGRLAASLSAAPERDTELITLLYKGPLPPEKAVVLLNAFADEIVRYTQQMQVREGTEVVRTLGEKLAAVETNIVQVQEEMQRIPPELRFTDPDKQTEAYLVQLSDLDLKYELARIDMEVNNPLIEKLQAARDELASLLVRYTEAYPLVQDAQARVNALEKQLAASTNSTGAGGKLPPLSPANSKARLATQQLEEIKALRQRIQDKLKGLSEKSINYALIKNRYQTLESVRLTLQSRQREAELYSQNALGYYQVLHPASLDQASNKLNWRKLAILIFGAGFLGMGGTIGLVLVNELLNSKIKTVGDLERVTAAPVLASVGDLSKMSPAEQDLWAFRTWTILHGKISHTKNRALVCGLISAQHGEGRSTWIKLLAKTAHQRGLRVLVAATRPTLDPPLHPHEQCDKKEAVMKIPVAQSVVTFPFQAAQQLNDPKSHAIVHIPLPGWVWNLERREQWQSALVEWTKINNLVFLVELPPASEPESILLAENLPQLIWLADSGKVSMTETRTHLETLRQAGCNLVGAVLNHEPRSFLKRHLSRWIGTAALLLALGLHAQAQELQEPTSANIIDTNTPSYISETNLPAPGTLSAPFVPTNRPDWQKHLTLGPGDIITLGFYGETNWTKTDVVIGMDGRVNYLQAHDIVATGLTVDQLRDAINKELAKYYRTPRAFVMPVAYHSKKYYVMGRVVTKGAYVLNRPISIVEAVSRARGLETAISDRNAVDLADLQRSFLLRQGKRVPVDFERLFQQGDFAQNVSLEPNDFLYFAPATLKEVYVMGEVRLPGIAPITDGETVMRVIVDRGGFTDEAYKQRIIVVRGSLSKPEIFTVNSWAILDAREADFKLKPRDIIYVSKRPFIRGEELADVAVTSFLQSATTAWAGDNIGPIITSPFVPSL